MDGVDGVHRTDPHRCARRATATGVSGDIQSGFERLIRMGRVDLTVEHAVLQPRWQELFEDQHREAAMWRLEQARTSGS